MIMKTKAFMGLLLVLLINAFYFNTVFCQDQLEEYTSTKIEVRADGSATWIIERRFLLKTEEDISIFEQYILEFESQKDSYLEDFSNKTQELVNRAKIITGRNMRAENFQITIDTIQTATAHYGIIIYQFDWIGFAKLRDNQITIGDVFEGGFYLYKDETLTVKYPKGYIVATVSPTPDNHIESDRTLIWYGYRNFGAGEPRVTLESETPNILSILQDNLFIVTGLLILAGVSFAFFYFLKSKKKRKKGGNVDDLLLQATLKKMEDDEEKVIRLLESAGGQLFQSLIAKYCGFSAAKTSELLTTMENKGIITRRKKGREKLVTLIKRNAEQGK